MPRRGKIAAYSFVSSSLDQVHCCLHRHRTPTIDCEYCLYARHSIHGLLPGTRYELNGHMHNIRRPLIELRISLTTISLTSISLTTTRSTSSEKPPFSRLFVPRIFGIISYGVNIQRTKNRVTGQRGTESSVSRLVNLLTTGAGNGIAWATSAASNQILSILL